MIRQWNLVRLIRNIWTFDFCQKFCYVVIMTSYFWWRHQKSDKYWNDDNFWTTNRKKEFDPHFVCIIHAQSENDVSAQNPANLWWRHAVFRPKMTSYDVTWRHRVGYSPYLQESFLLMISCLSPSMKSFALRELWTIKYFRLHTRNI